MSEWMFDPDYQAYANELVERTPDSWDDDASQESITLDYLRHVEAEVMRLGGCLHRFCRWSDGEPCDHGYLPVAAPAPDKVEAPAAPALEYCGEIFCSGHPAEVVS